MATGTVTARRKGEPQYYVGEKIEHLLGTYEKLLKKSISNKLTERLQRTALARNAKHRQGTRKKPTKRIILFHMILH